MQAQRKLKAKARDKLAFLAKFAGVLCFIASLCALSDTSGQLWNSEQAQRIYTTRFSPWCFVDWPRSKSRNKGY